MLFEHTDPCAGVRQYPELGCKACSWWSPPDLTRNASYLEPWPKLQRHSHGKLRLPWFLCLSKPTDEISKRNTETARAAIVSARLNAPSIEPHVVYMHHPQQALDEDYFTRWLSSMRVRTIMHRLSFEDLIPPSLWDRRTSSRFAHTPEHINIGAYCRMDLPVVAANLSAEWMTRGITPDTYLYTDTDVLFAGDVDTEAMLSHQPQLPTFAAGTEPWDPNPIALNSGVMLVNASAMRAELPWMLQYANERKFRFFLVDQTWLIEWFLPFWGHVPSTRRQYWIDMKKNLSSRFGWRTLDNALWNGRGFAHPQQPDGDANVSQAVVLPHIWHWQGYKSTELECILRQLRLNSTCNASGCDHSTTLARTGNIRPIAECPSTSRFISIRFSSPCWLRTYTWLLKQHYDLLHLADSVSSHVHVQQP